MTKGQIQHTHTHVVGVREGERECQCASVYTHKWEMQINSTKRIENCADGVGNMENMLKGETKEREKGRERE